MYKVSYCIRAAEMFYGSICVSIVDADNEEQYLSVEAPQRRDDGPYYHALSNCEWTQKCVVFTTKAETHRLTIRVARLRTGMEARGTAWLDDIRVERVRCGYEPLGSCVLDPQSGKWSTTLPLEPGQNVFAFVARPLRARPYLGMARLLSVYRSDDSDGDGLPDWWETEWFGSLSFGPKSDPDLDKVTNEREFLLGMNPSCADTDGDLVTDDVEVSYGLDPTTDDGASDLDGDGLTNMKECLEYGTNPAESDTDGDGLNDGEEVTLHETNPLLWDTDQDGQSDSDELFADTDPNDPASVFAITQVSVEETGVRLRWNAVFGRTYRVYISDEVMGPWTPLNGDIEANGETIEVTDMCDPLTRCRLYRVRIMP